MADQEPIKGLGLLRGTKQLAACRMRAATAATPGRESRSPAGLPLCCSALTRLVVRCAREWSRGAPVQTKQPERLLERVHFPPL